ncbi:uncharacterized protein c19h1orf94 [Austrofundulus limnaeus]|uniref:Uncharacterized protein c19h1orf94 n=1 Tax=Austrofundulus limnaeus TaxID=52670 RepID=A0A2I4C9Y1_AUSLI|nr:PREDICTED: uncharacterized protein LOC106526675 [Austrofundulus limnaeus]
MVKLVFRAFVPFPRSTWIHPNAPEDGLDRVCKVIWSRATELLRRGDRSPQSPTNEATASPHNEPSGRRPEEQQRKTKDSGSNEQDKRHNTDFTLRLPYRPNHRNEEEQKEAINLSLSRKHDEDKMKNHANFIHPSTQISGSRAKERQKKMDDFVLSKDKKQPHTDFSLPRPHPSGCKPLVEKPTQILSPAMQPEIKIKLENDAGDNVKIVENPPNKMCIPQIK